MMAELDILNGFAGKVISDCIDISINAIKKADKNRKTKNQTMEARIYQVTIDALNVFPYNKYKKDEKVYDAAESILKELKKGNGNYKEAVRFGLSMLSAEITGDKCENFLRILHDEICMDENDILYKEILLLQEEEILENIHEGFDVSNRNDEETHRKLDYLIEMENGKDIQDANYSVKNPVVNRAYEYAQRWDKNVFLNDFNKRDKNAGVNITLKEIYSEEHLPHYKWKADDESLTDLKELLREYTIDNDDKKMLLILGQAGIGKSTLITWIMANLVEKKDEILVYQFASDLGNVNWQSNNILDEIFATIGLEYNEVEGKALILDGFDEIYVKGDRERVLHKLNQELEKKNYLKRFSLIITCRENYVNKLELRRIEYITLQAWGEAQIRSFCGIYEEVATRKGLESIVNKNSEVKINRIIEKKDIMGIPLILYMVLALNVDIERSSSTVDIYDQIFSKKRGGIYDRNYDTEHRINEPEIKKHIHRISQQMAFWMFENNTDEASIPQEKFEEICDNEMRESGKKGEGIQRDTLIGNFFVLKYCEGKGTDEIQFVHRSIYEYFVVVYFYESLCNLKSKEEIAGKLGELLKYGQLSKQMLEFIKYKFDNMGGYNLADTIRAVFNIMLRDGMTYHTGKSYSNVIEREMNIFANMLEVVSLWNSSLGKVDNKIILYLQCNSINDLNLSGVKLHAANLSGANLYSANLSGANLSRADLIRANLYASYLRGASLNKADLNGADLSEANLSRADLNEANLNGANLNGANLIGADLSGADLNGSNLNGVDLNGANLNGANLNGANLNEADLNEANLNEANLCETIFDEDQVNLLCKKYDLTDSRVYIFETQKVISYQEYSHKKQRI